MIGVLSSGRILSQFGAHHFLDDFHLGIVLATVNQKGSPHHGGGNAGRPRIGLDNAGRGSFAELFEEGVANKGALVGRAGHVVVQCAYDKKKRCCSVVWCVYLFLMVFCLVKLWMMKRCVVGFAKRSHPINHSVRSNPIVPKSNLFRDFASASVPQDGAPSRLLTMQQVKLQYSTIMMSRRNARLLFALLWIATIAQAFVVKNGLSRQETMALQMGLRHRIGGWVGRIRIRRPKKDVVVADPIVVEPTVLVEKKKKTKRPETQAERIVRLRSGKLTSDEKQAFLNATESSKVGTFLPTTSKSSKATTTTSLSADNLAKQQYVNSVMDPNRFVHFKTVNPQKYQAQARDILERNQFAHEQIFWESKLTRDMEVKAAELQRQEQSAASNLFVDDSKNDLETSVVETMPNEEHCAPVKKQPPPPPLPSSQTFTDATERSKQWGVDLDRLNA